MSAPLHPLQRYGILRLAYWYLERQQPRRAESLTRGLLALNSDDGHAWLYFGEARLLLDDLDGGADALLRAARTIGDDPTVWLRLAIARQRQRRFPQAQEALLEARRLASDPRLSRRIDCLLRRVDSSHL